MEFRDNYYEKIELIRLNENSYKEWDKLVRMSPQGQLYHTTKWLTIAEDHTKTELFILIALIEKEVIGGIPIFLDSKYRGMFKRCMSPPYPSLTQVPNLGPIFAHYGELKQHKKESRLIGFQSSFDDYVNSKIKPDFIQIIATINLMDIRPFQWSGYDVTPRFTYVGDIKNKELSWKRLEQETRREITKAERLGIKLEEGGLDEYKYVCKSYIERHKEKGIGINISWPYLFDIFKKFYPDNLRIFIAKYQGENVGHHIYVLYKDKITFWLGGVRSKLKGVNPNRFIAWKVIEWAVDRGYRYYEDIGGNHPSISAFKSKFGFNLKLYFEMSKSSSKYKIIRKLRYLKP